MSDGWPDDRTAQVRRCTGADLRDGGRRRAAARLVDGLVRRRTWSLHRHVHLVAAFEHVRTRCPIRSVLAVGCGAGHSELFLAVANPSVHVTLTDLDPGRLAVASRLARQLRITNVTVQPLDLLTEPLRPRADLVTGIEVLEHIEDDARAAACIEAMAGRAVYQLVPQCPPSALADPARIRSAWERHEHVRPGYTPTTLAALFDGSLELAWMRSCYMPPDALALRTELRGASDASLARRREVLVARALDDLRPDAAIAGEGLEVLGLRPSMAAGPAVARDDDRPLPSLLSAPGARSIAATGEAAGRRAARVVRRVARERRSARSTTP